MIKYQMEDKIILELSEVKRLFTFEYGIEEEASNSEVLLYDENWVIFGYKKPEIRFKK